MSRRVKHDVKDDPVVAEVRRVRARLWQEAGGTVEALVRLMQEDLQPVRKVRNARAGKRQKT